nr:MAG: hypothetical protein [Microvirus Sku14]
MNRSLSYKNGGVRTFDCSKYGPTDVPVQNNLAMTPAKVAELTAQGIAVSLDSTLNYDSSSSDNSFDLDPIFSRGMDQQTLWERQQLARQKISFARNRKKISKDSKSNGNE